MSKKRKRKGRDKKENDKPEETAPAEAKETKETKKPISERQILIFLSVFLFIICLVVIVYAYNLRREISNYDENLTNCSLALEEAELEAESGDIKINKLEREIEALRLGVVGGFELPEKYAREFEKKGLREPIEDIKTSLMKNMDIIPYKDIGNRKLRFISRNEVYVISPDKALANFSDGENFGWLLAGYTVIDRDNIKWKVADSYCPYYDK